MTSSLEEDVEYPSGPGARSSYMWKITALTSSGVIGRIREAAWVAEIALLTKESILDTGIEKVEEENNVPKYSTAVA